MAVKKAFEKGAMKSIVMEKNEVRATQGKWQVIQTTYTGGMSIEPIMKQIKQQLSTSIPISYPRS